MSREIKFRAIFDNIIVEYVKWENCMWLYSKDQLFWKAERTSAHTFLAQYTGLKDKNGKEIYEGDIVTWPRDRWGSKTSEVVWETELARFSIDLYPLTDARDYEVIGNIYENKDLLA